MSLMLLTRIGWARHSLPFLTALVVSARYDRRKGRRHKTVTDYAQRCWSACAGGCPGPGGGGRWPAKREFLRHCQSIQSRLSSSPNCARTHPGTSPRQRGGGQIGRPRVVGARLPSPTAVLDDPVPTAVPPWSSSNCGTTLRRVSHTLGRHQIPEERRGPYALLCTDTEAEPLRTQWYHGGRSR